jgi:hypothetical protein
MKNLRHTYSWRDNFSSRNLAYGSVIFLLSISSSIWVFLIFPKDSIRELIFSSIAYVFTSIFTILLLHKLIFPYSLSRLDSCPLIGKVSLVGACLLSGIWLAFNIPVTSPTDNLISYINAVLYKILFKFSVGILLGLVLYLIIVSLATIIGTRQQSISKTPLVRRSFKYSLPIGVVWGIYLLAYFPGMMSADSMVQWEQILTGKFVDHHPAFHTFLLWLVTRIYLSPATIAIAQIVSLALIAGLWFAFLESLGVRQWIIWSLAFIFAVVPVNGTMVNTLWKDIPYSTAVLGLTLILALIVVTKGKWISSTASKIILGITVALVLLIRKDGVTVGVGTLLLLIIVYPRKWKSWLASCAICAFLYFGIRGPVYNWVGVEKSNLLLESSVSPYTIAAYANSGSETDRLVSSMNILSPNWNCSILNISADRLNADLNYSITTTQIITNLFRHLPNLLMFDARCSRSLEWVIWDPFGEVRNTSHVEVLVDPNPYGIKPDSKIPALREAITNWVYKTSHDPNLNWFIWRPALFLYINLVVSMVLIIRNHDIRFGLLSVPILIQSISFTLILAAPNFRYHYAVYLISLISIALLFSPSMTKNINQTKIDSSTQNKMAS